MQQYLDMIKLVFTHGKHTGDRTGTGITKVFGHQTKFNLAAGFPLLTTKKTSKAVTIREKLWFLSGSTNVKDLQKHNLHFWDAWADEDGNIGEGYGKQFRNIEHSYWVKPLIFEPDNNAPVPQFSKTIEVDWSIHRTKLLGKQLESQTSGWFTVIKEIPVWEEGNHRTRFVVKFHWTGNEVKAGYSAVEDGKVADPWYPSVLGIGRYGDYDANDQDYELLVNVWRDMLKRCYDRDSKSYESYGAVGVHVSPEWLIFANFQKDAKKLPCWTMKKEWPQEYSLDKDIKHASNRYSSHTCMWASKREQHLNTSQVTPFKATSPEGKEEIFSSLGEMKQKHGVNLSAIHRCLNGKLHTHHGWSKFEYLINPGHVLRTRIVDQVKEVISTIKHDPYSRRHMISLWNASEIHRMNLPCCHGSVIQFDVCEGELNCSIYQRSADLIIGVPINIASYALLTIMIAHLTGLKPGTLTYTFGNLHIYDNLREEAFEQLKREPRQLPQLKINRQVTDIDDFKYEDFELVGYNPHPIISVKDKVAV